jgi:hypothetical protein
MAKRTSTTTGKRTGRKEVAESTTEPAESVASELSAAEKVADPPPESPLLTEFRLQDSDAEATLSEQMPNPSPSIAAVESPAAGLSNAQAAVTRVFDVFLIDSGWNNLVCDAVRQNLPTLGSFLKNHRFFVMNREQSLEYIKNHPGLVGADPVLAVVDRTAAQQRSPSGYGFRLCLGNVRQPEVAIAMLKWAVQLTLTASGAEMVAMVRKSAYRDSMKGVIELIGEGSAHLLEFAPV